MNHPLLACLLTATLLLGCGQPPAPPQQSPTSTVPDGPVEPPTGPVHPPTTSTQAPIKWADKLTLDKADVLKFTESQGGVAGTDYTTLEVRGDGAVSQETGGPGHPPSSKKGKLDAKATRELFEQVQKSGLLDTTEAHTSQHWYSVGGEVDKVKLDVGVMPGTTRYEDLEKLVAPARAVLK